jgi:peptide/nickel transport system substrate-binding protein
VPKDYLERVGTEGFIAHPIGCGPFTFVEGQREDQIVMKCFDNYYGGSEDLPPVGPASLDRLMFRFVPEGSTRMAALQIGEVHIINLVPIHDIWLSE